MHRLVMVAGLSANMGAHSRVAISGISNSNNVSRLMRKENLMRISFIDHNCKYRESEAKLARLTNRDNKHQYYLHIKHTDEYLEQAYAKAKDVVVKHADVDEWSRYQAWTNS